MILLFQFRPIAMGTNQQRGAAFHKQSRQKVPGLLAAASQAQRLLPALKNMPVAQVMGFMRKEFDDLLRSHWRFVFACAPGIGKQVDINCIVYRSRARSASHHEVQLWGKVDLSGRFRRANGTISSNPSVRWAAANRSRKKST